MFGRFFRFVRNRRGDDGGFGLGACDDALDALFRDAKEAGASDITERVSPRRSLRVSS